MVFLWKMVIGMIIGLLVLNFNNHPGTEPWRFFHAVSMWCWMVIESNDLKWWLDIHLKWSFKIYLKSIFDGHRINAWLRFSWSSISTCKKMCLLVENGPCTDCFPCWKLLVKQPHSCWRSSPDAIHVIHFPDFEQRSHTGFQRYIPSGYD